MAPNKLTAPTLAIPQWKFRQFVCELNTEITVKGLMFAACVL